MKGKVLLIDFDGTRKNRIFYKMFIRWLYGHDFEVAEFYGDDDLDFYKLSGDEKVKLSVDKAIGFAKGVDLVYVHFGSMQRVEAAEILSRFKTTGAKVIVESVSPKLFEAADYIFCMDVQELQKNILKFCQEKNRG